MNLDDVLVAIAGHRLGRSKRLDVDRPLDRRQWAGLRKELDTGLLAAEARAAAADGILAVTTEQRRDLDRLVAAAVLRRDAAAARLVEAAAVLESQAVDTCVIQGAATAALDYPDPSARLYRSVHLLVSPAQLGRAEAALQAEGLTPLSETRTRRARGVRLVAGEGVEVELHRALVAGSFGAGADPVALFAGREWFSVGDAKLRGLSGPARLIAACLRARLDPAPPRLVALRDVVQLVLRDDVSLRAVERLAVAWKVQAAVADAVRWAWSVFEVPDVVPLSAWAAAYQPDRRERRRLAAYPVATAGLGGAP